MENLVVNVSESEKPSDDDYVKELYVLAKENDPGQQLVDIVEWGANSTDFQISDCIDCFRKIYHGDGGVSYDTGSDYGIGYEFAGIPKWAWHYQIVKLIFSDGLESIKATLSISYVPHDFPTRKGMSLEEFKALRPGADSTKVLQTSNSTVATNSTIVVEDTSDKDVKIKIAEIDQGPAFDITAFLQTYR